jgi:hypothetical protein
LAVDDFCWRRRVLRHIVITMKISADHPLDRQLAELAKRLGVATFSKGFPQ